jgi:hypothetical protein
MKAFLVFPKKSVRSVGFTQQYPSVPEDDRPTLIIAADMIVAVKEFPDAIRITKCDVKDVVIKKEKQP